MTALELDVGFELSCIDPRQTAIVSALSLIGMAVISPAKSTACNLKCICFLYVMSFIGANNKSAAVSNKYEDKKKGS